MMGSASDGTKPRLPVEKFYQAASLMMILGACSMILDLVSELGATALILGIIMVFCLDDADARDT